MKQLKKTLLTLALLLTAATGAWAQSAVASIGSENYTTLQAAFTAAETGQTIKLLSDVTQVGGVGKSDGKAVTFDLNGHIYTCTEDYVVMATSNSQITIIDSSTGTPGGIKSEHALVGQGNGKIIIKAGRYNIGDLTAEELLEYFPNWCVEMYSGYTLQDITPADAQGFCVGVVAPASSGPEVAWNKTSNTGTFTMPGGNVTLEPDYYPQAALAAAPTAIDDVPATTDGAIVNPGTVANIGETTTAQGTLMYYVSQTALDDAALLALAADQWTADVPTAKSLAEGQAYVYYYVKGNDSDTDEENFSDGDILSANALQVTIADEPTYAVTFADDTAEPTLWTAEPNAGVTKGQTVTVTYTGSKKVIGVKAEKKARPEFVPSATIQDLSSFVEVKNNKDGTITLHMPTLNPSTYNVTNSTISNGEHTLHFGYEMGSGTNMSSIGVNILSKSWNDHTPFSELDKTIDITSGMPRVAIMITGHVKSSTCPAPGKEHYWGLYRYTNPVKVTYNLGGGSVSGSTADKVEYLFSGDALATTFAAPTREGYTFDGWYTSAEGGTKLTASNATSATTIYAHWNAIAE